MKLSQLEQSDKFVGLLAGRSGHGKSVALASFAEAGPLYVMDLDRRAKGMLGVKDLLSSAEIDSIDIDQSFEISKGFGDIDTKLETMSIKARTNQLEYKTIAIESFGSLVKCLLFDSLKLRGEHKGKVRGQVRFFTPDDYNYVSMAINQLFYKCLLTLRCNLVISGWVVDRYGKDPTQNEYAPSVIIGQKMLGPSNVAEEILGYFDEVYFFEKEETGLSQSPLRYSVSFEGNLAKTSNPNLHGLGKLDITGKKFYQEYHKLTNKGKTT